MTVTLAVTEEIWDELIGALESDVETAAFLLAGVADSKDELTLLGRGISWVPDEAYVERDERHMVISSAGFVPALKAAHDDSSVPVFVHTHPQGKPQPSDLDDIVDERLREPAQLRSGQTRYAHLIIGGTRISPRFTGRLYNEVGDILEISRVRIIGRRFQLLRAADQPEPEVDLDVFDRHVRAFGEDGQKLLAQLRVGVVGLGGTGSAVVEQLARLGIGHLLLIDDDVLTDKNLTRIHESARSDVDRRKTDVMVAAVERIALGTTVRALHGRATEEDIARELRQLDIVFGCTDDQAGRAKLARFAVWYLVPVIDMGFIIDTDENKRVRGLFGRVTTLLPGAACLLCRQHITAEGIRVDGLPEEERQRLAAEGYAPGLGDPDPSVGVYTTMTATFALNAMLERLFGYSPDAGGSTELIIRVDDLKLSRNSRPPTLQHFCGNKEKWGRGDTDQLLETTW